MRWLLVVSAIVVVVGLLMSSIITDPDNADTQLFLIFVGAAIVIPFLALALPRQRVLEVALPTDHLANATRQDLQGMLDGLEEGKRKGEITPDRYAKARDRILAEMKGKKV